MFCDVIGLSVFYLAASAKAKRLVLVLRGSKSLLDWLTNFTVWATPLWLRCGSITGTGTGTGLRHVGSVHEGIMRHVHFLQQQVGKQFGRKTSLSSPLTLLLF